MTFSKPVGEPLISRPARRAAGIYYTPPEVVALILDCVLSTTSHSPRSNECPPRLLDFACGAGEFLVQAYRRFDASFGRPAARSAIFGLDTDRQAIATANSRLTAIDPQFHLQNMQVADTLLDDRLRPESFDAIVGNPPYINIRQLAKSHSQEQIANLRARFQTARGNFDFYTLFIERALELLRPGGRCGLVVPNKWATLDYARPCRELLLRQTTIEHVIDLSHSKAFAKASVYPHILVFRKCPAPASHAICVTANRARTSHLVQQQTLSPRAILLNTPLDLESRVATVPLESVAKLCCGTAGYSASRIAARLTEAAEQSQQPSQRADFITTSNIDRYAIQLGHVRFLNRNYTRPQLPLNIPELTSQKQRLFRERKILIAGMSQRIEAAWDDQSLALGVQVFAARDFQANPFYLLAVLNSKLLSYVFATRFSGKQLAGGYLSINKGQLALLPIRKCTTKAEQRLADRVAHLAAHWIPAHDDEIDQRTYELYGLSDKEVARVEANFHHLAAAAA